MADLSIYIHWPFCQSKCPYCDFNSFVAASIDHDAWRAAYPRELAHYAKQLPNRRVTSIFFGGGTPSLMQPETVATILETIGKLWTLAPDTEITLEANPGSVDADKFVSFRAAGINRLSLGIQSLQPDALQFLGRGHSVEEGKRAIDLAARHFDRYSFDLIYARHGQTPEAWEEELREALTLAGDHLSMYQLTIEPATHFYTLARRGTELTAPDEQAATMYEMTQELMAAAGLPSYEISNHARPGGESRHNLCYWHYNDYIGIGPGAHGRYQTGGIRYASENHRTPDVWMKHVMTSDHGRVRHDVIDHHTARREALMMGLRLTTGIRHDDWQQKFPQEKITDFLNPSRLQRLCAEDYITVTPDGVKPTASGLQRLNAVLDYLMNE